MLRKFLVLRRLSRTMAGVSLWLTSRNSFCEKIPVHTPIARAPPYSAARMSFGCTKTKSNHITKRCRKLRNWYVGIKSQLLLFLVHNTIQHVDQFHSSWNMSIVFCGHPKQSNNVQLLFIQSSWHLKIWVELYYWHSSHESLFIPILFALRVVHPTLFH